jgi:hypothetical protein
MREGKPEEALALYRRTLQTSPDSVPANIAAGRRGSVCQEEAVLAAWMADNRVPSWFLVRAPDTCMKRLESVSPALT